MNEKLVSLLAALTLCGTLGVRAQSTAFTYQGRLTDNGAPANGRYDLRAALFDSPSDGNVLGATNVLPNVAVSNGLFTVQFDFGDAAFVGGGVRWLELAVRTNGSVGSYSTLAPRQPLTPAPMALWAGLAGTAYAAAANSITTTALQNHAVTGEKIASGQMVKSLNGLTDAVMLTAGPNVTVTPSGNSLRIGANPGNDWTRTGNAGTTPSVNFLGTTDNQPLELRVNNARAYRLEPNQSGAPNLIGGAPVNGVADGVIGATIAGGGVLDFFGAGALSNSVTAHFGTVGGGAANRSGPASTIAGGGENQADATYATIGGENRNRIQPEAWYGTISGGYFNTVQSNARNASIGGGDRNTVRSDAWSATIGGGHGNVIDSSAQFGTIGGGDRNIIQTNASGATIAGGTVNTVQRNTYDTTISGGAYNTIEVGTSGATVAGGSENAIQAGANSATINGGSENTIQADAGGATIAGGRINLVRTHAELATIGGGLANRVSAPYGTIAGGGYSEPEGAYGNLVTDEGGFVGGGADNHAGNGNDIKTDAYFASAVGGWGNTASGKYAAVPGGLSNTAQGDLSFAAGRRAKATHTGAFVWCDSLDQDGGSQGVNTFTVRASGGTYFYSSGGNTGVRLLAGSGSWDTLSDRASKTNFSAVNPRDVLERVVALPMESWSYAAQDPSIRHLGPMAQDFHAAFGLGADEKTIATVDADGVALAAIQGLNRKLEETRAENVELKRRLAELERVVSKLTAKAD